MSGRSCVPLFASLPERDRRAVDPVTFARGTRPAGIGEFAVHVQHASGSGAFVQRIDVLRDHDDFVLALQCRNREMRGVGFGGPRLRAPLVVELEHQRRVRAPALGTS